MADGITFIFIGIIIGALFPFVAAWVTYDRSVHEVAHEARALREESEELRRLAGDLAKILDGQRERLRDEAGAPRVLAAAAVDESMHSVSVERELGGARVRPAHRPA